MYLKVPTKIEIKTSPGKGLGCFAIEDIYEGEIIEECHVLEIPGDSIQHDLTLFKEYRFNYPAEEKWNTQVIPFGYGCIYNHSDNPNIFWRQHPRYKAFQFVAKRDIKKGEELCSFYGGDDYWDQRPYIKKV